MPLKKASGNMYDWVTHLHSELGGECSHQCKYCYVNKGRFAPYPRYCGEPRLIEADTKTRFGSGKIIFKEHMNDLFASCVPDDIVQKVLNHCQEWPDNTYVFQSKNPARYKDFDFSQLKVMRGTTIETNREIDMSISCAPRPSNRFLAMSKRFNGKKFITIEPIMDFDVNVLSMWMKVIEPDFINIGADSKWCGLPEPSTEKVQQLILKLRSYGLTVNIKPNLIRLM